jgi:hypothetical protein
MKEEIKTEWNSKATPGKQEARRSGDSLPNLGLAFDVKLRFAGALVYAQDRRLFLTAAPSQENGHHSAKEAA